MSFPDRIRLLVLHGDPVSQAGLSVAFSSFPDFEVLGISRGRDEQPSVISVRPGGNADVILADYANGVALAAEVAARGSLAATPKVVVFSGNDREWEIRSALERGVRGYLLVGCSLEELAQGVRAVHRGARHLCAQAGARLAESISLEPLTPREDQVLRLVVDGLCNKAIGRRLGIAVGTVKSHLKSAFDKLNVDSRTQAVAVVERRGLLRRPFDRQPERIVPDAAAPAWQVRLANAAARERVAETAAASG